MSRYIVFTLTLALAGALAAFAARPAPTETLLGPLTQETLDEFSVAAYPQEGVLAHMGPGADGKPAYIINGKADQSITASSGAQVSADGTLCLYVGERDGKQIVVLKTGNAPGVVQGAYAQVQDRFLTAKAQHVLYAASRDGKQFVVANGLEGDGHADVRDGSLLLTPDESTLFYVALDGGKAALIKRDLAAEKAAATPTDPPAAPAAKPAAKETKGPVVDEIGLVKLSGDGRRLAYAARVGKQWTVVVVGLAAPADGIDLPAGPPPAADAKPDAKLDDAVKVDPARAYDQITSIVFSPDNAKVLWVARVARKMSIIQDGALVKEGDAIAGLFFLKDGVLGYVTGKWVTKPPQTKPVPEYQIVIGDKTSEGFDWLDPNPVLGGVAHSAFRVKRGDKFAYLIDGTLTAWYGYVSPLLYSQDGAHYVFTARQPAAFEVVRDGRVIGTYPAMQAAVMSQDGTRIAVATLAGGRWTVAIDGAVVGTHEEVAGLKFSPDGTHLCYGAKVGGLWSVGVDGVAGATYERLLGFITMDDGGPQGTASAMGFIAPRSIRYYGWKGGKAYLVEETLP